MPLELHCQDAVLEAMLPIVRLFVEASASILRAFQPLSVEAAKLAILRPTSDRPSIVLRSEFGAR
jgi:hypothetical protein